MDSELQTLIIKRIFLIDQSDMRKMFFFNLQLGACQIGVLKYA